MTKAVSATLAFLAILMLPLILICASDPTGFELRVVGIWVINVAIASIVGIRLFKRNRKDDDSHFNAVW